MLVKNIVVNACKFLSLNNVINYLNNETESDDDTLEKFNNIMVACNLANSNIATNYFPIKLSKKINVYNNKINYNEITTSSILRIDCIRRSGVKISGYKILSDCIEIVNGEYTIEYSIFPDEITIESEINYYHKIDENIFALLVVAEYLFISGFVDEGEAWKDKFDVSMKSILNYKKSVSMPKRRWL